ncbi:PAS domain-containing sensor histidine kinase [Bacillus sp. UMB0899]|uniref:ATP-binding protein n=1 Tax=Metabacillus schmidteae TaxID=2730405 RepID=UPI000C808AC6|nr:ATP-binding protein [Metabacillus schmidteae]PMC36748.1 PAS domain-containing sensor histidine kinase [Bacillus sp. UMB0899]
MNRSGQIILVLISVLFTAYQTVVGQEPFFTVDFFIFTSIAFLVGRQYDLAKFYAKKAKLQDESYKKLVDTFPESIIIHKNNKVCYVNHATVKMVGARTKEELIDQSILDFIVPKYKARAEERIKISKREKSPLSNIEYELIRIDGTTFFFEGTSISISYGTSEATLTIGKDITEKKHQTEKLLLKSEKLALLGQMAAGIAHEIRNPLTSIKGFIQLFKSNHLQEEYYNIVLSELDRINAIVGEFLVLSKPSASIFVEKDLNELIKDVITLMSTQSILNNVQIFAEFDSNLPQICCEEAQLKQVFLNLFKNAIEAMPDGGNIHLKLKENEKGAILIQVIDEGVGIPPERIPTLGEPFYTTKEKGTGLGLMTCYKIIESHKGELSIHSEVNKGTTIEILIPTMTQPLLKRELV